MDRCPFCQLKLTQIERAGHALMRTGPNMMWIRAHCDSCGLWFQQDICGNTRSTWYSTLVPPGQLTGALTAEELSELDEKMGIYASLGQRWQEFKSLKKPDDVFWKFRDSQSGKICVAIVRRGMPVADFRTVPEILT